MGVYKVGRLMWRSVPSGMRAKLLALSCLQQWRDVVIQKLMRWSPRDDIYTQDYYRQFEQWSAQTAPSLVSAIVELIHPASAIEIGCGIGNVLYELKCRGIRAVGLECSTAAISMCREKGLDVREFDVAKDNWQGTESFEVVICMEVAEHIPEKYAEKLVALLCRFRGVVVFTAAPRGQGGTDHVNEQPREYWEAKFMSMGFAEDDRMRRRIVDIMMSGGSFPVYCQNLMVFAKIDSCGGSQT